jgi:hypothetical protein
MADIESIHLSLLDNSHAFLREGVSKAIAAKNDARQWQFAIVHVVQSLELSLKSVLHQIHPAFIYENIDKPRNTVGPRHAIERLASVSTVTLTEIEKRKLLDAIELRNRITHFEFELRTEHAMAKFFETFASVVYFQGRHLGNEIDSIIDEDELSQLIAIAKSTEELAEKARQRIEEEEIDGEFIWECPNCMEDTFVAQDEIDTCYTCRYSETIVLCEKCRNCRFEFEMESFAADLEYFQDEGWNFLHNDFGYSYRVACPDCIKEIKEDIQRQRDEEEWHYQMEEDYYYERLHREQLENQ